MFNASRLAALSLLALAACAAPAADDSESTSSDLVTASPGTATLALGLGPVPKTETQFRNYGYSFSIAKSSTDEYLRDGESVVLSVDQSTINLQALPSFTPSKTELQAWSADVEVTFFRGGDPIGSQVVTTGAWEDAEYVFQMTAKTNAFTIPAGTDEIGYELTAHAPGNIFDGNKMHGVDFNRSPVIGAFVPNKLVLFDTNGAAKRTRTLEGGQPVAGAGTSVVYTDYRTDTILDASTIDATIGHVQDEVGRGGQLGSPHAVYGKIEREVWMGVYDDVNGWAAERKLDQQNAPRLVSSPPPNANRYTFEGQLVTPSGASQLQVYFHVKAYLVVHYAYAFKTVDHLYNEGDRILVRDRYDNPSGPGTNYTFPLEH